MNTNSGKLSDSWRRPSSHGHEPAKRTDWAAIFLSSPLGRDLKRLWTGELSKRAQALHRERLEEAQIRYSWIARQSRMAQRLRVIATQSLRAGGVVAMYPLPRGLTKVVGEFVGAVGIQIIAPPPNTGPRLRSNGLCNLRGAHDVNCAVSQSAG